jgi:hypothetical protein
MLAATYAEEIEREAKERQKFHGGTAPGRPRTLPPQEGGSVPGNPRTRETTRMAARKHGVSKDKVQRVITLKKKASDLYRKIEAGLVPLSEAWQTYLSRSNPSVIDAPARTLPNTTNGNQDEAPDRRSNDGQGRKQPTMDTLRSAVDELKHVFDVFTCVPGSLLCLSPSQRRLILARSEGIAEIARKSLTAPNSPHPG